MTVRPIHGEFVNTNEYSRHSARHDTVRRIPTLEDYGNSDRFTRSLRHSEEGIAIWSSEPRRFSP